MNKILKLAVADTRVQDFFDFKLFVTIHDHGRRWILDTTWNVIRTDRFKERHMEHWVDSHRLG
jgi:hypothetical protein